MLDTLRQIVQEVNSTEDLAEALDIVVRQVSRALESDACSVYLIDPHTKEYVLAATEGLNTKVGKVRLKLGQGLIGLVGDREEPINVENMLSHPNFFASPGLGEENFHGFLGVPMIHQRRVMGIITIYQSEQRLFAEDEQSFLVTLAAQLVGVIAHAQVVGTEFLQKSIWKRRKKQSLNYNGIPACSGVAFGQSIVIYPSARLDLVPERKTEDIDSEFKRYTEAVEIVKGEITNLRDGLTNFLNEENRAVFDVYIQILESDSLYSDVKAEILKGFWAPWALRKVIDGYIAELEKTNNEYMLERKDDFRELGRRVLSQLQSQKRLTPNYPDNTILIGEQLTAASIAEVPEGKLAGVVSLEGSSNSHLSILARALGIPTVVGLEGACLKELDNKEVIVDGYYGQIYINPDRAVRREFIRLKKEEDDLQAELSELRDLPAETIDGHRVKLEVNTGLAADISQSLQVGAEGVGLYRTEIPFMARDRFPTENEQTIIYRQLLKAFSPRPVTMRTLDIGGDKSLPYFEINEQNPFLGWRGIRVTLDHPDIFLVQMKAMLRANAGLGNLRILLPFISSIGELEEAMRLYRQAYDEVREDYPDLEKPELGVMIEVPAAVTMAEDIARRVDFLSVGSNDLTQYILAVDRNNSRVANLYESLHPAVLRALKQIVDNGKAERCSVSICGEIAGDPIATIILLALGYDSLSMSASRLLQVKWVIRNFTKQRSEELLEEIWALDDAQEIRRYMESVLEEEGLGGLVRAGK